MPDIESGGDKSTMSWKKATENMVQNNDDVIYIGVYSLDTLDQIASSGSDKINITKREMSAIVTHTRSSLNVVAAIKITGLNFACLSFGSVRMIGMSNFNVDNESVEEVDKTLHDLANIRYTRQDSFEAQHMLNISAVLQEEVILVGLAVSSETTSVLQVLQDTISHRKGETISKNEMKRINSKPSLVVKKTNKKSLVTLAKETSKPSFVMQENEARKSCLVIEEKEGNKISLVQHATEPKITSGNTNEEVPASAFIWNIPSNENQGESLELKQQEVTEIQRRKSTKEEIERRKDSTKRETEFCEDWRTATIRSIEALRNIGPFSEGSSYDDDQRPLISSESVPHSKQSPDVSCNTPRRASRPTMV